MLILQQKRVFKLHIPSILEDIRFSLCVNVMPFSEVSNEFLLMWVPHGFLEQTELSKLKVSLPK